MSSKKDYKKTEFDEFVKRDYTAEHRVYYSNPYNEKTALKRDIEKFLSTPYDKYYKEVKDLVDDEDDKTNIKFDF